MTSHLSLKRSVPGIWPVSRSGGRSCGNGLEKSPHRQSSNRRIQRHTSNPKTVKRDPSQRHHWIQVLRSACAVTPVLVPPGVIARCERSIGRNPFALWLSRVLRTIGPAALKCRRPITIDRTFHRESILLEHMRLDLRGSHVLVPEQFLNRPDVGSIGQQVSGKGMPKRVTTGVLWDT